MAIDKEAVILVAPQLLLGAFAAHLIGLQVGLYGWSRLFVVPENRVRLYTTSIVLTAAALWPQFFPTADQPGVALQVAMILVCVFMFASAYLAHRK